MESLSWSCFCGFVLILGAIETSLAQEHKNWASNQRTKQNNFKRLLQYELYIKEKAAIRKREGNRKAKEEQEAGIESFEHNIKRLGLDGENKEQKLTPAKESGKYDPSMYQWHPGTRILVHGISISILINYFFFKGIEYLNRIRSKFEGTVGKHSKEVGDIMTELKDKAELKKIATKEKEVRRRKVKGLLVHAIPLIQERLRFFYIWKGKAFSPMTCINWNVFFPDLFRRSTIGRRSRRLLIKRIRGQRH